MRRSSCPGVLCMQYLLNTRILGRIDERLNFAHMQVKADFWRQMMGDRKLRASMAAA